MTIVTYSICSERNSATVYVVAKRYDWEWGVDAGSVCHGGGSVCHGGGSVCHGGGSVRRQPWRLPVPRHGDAAPGQVPFAVSCGGCLCPGTATGQRTPGRALCTPRPCASPVRRCAVPSLTPASPGPAAIRSCSPRPFADVLSAHPGTVPSLGGPGWRFPPLLVFSLFLTFFMAEGFVKSFRPHRNTFKKTK